MGIGTPSEGFACDIYIARVRSDRDWLCDVCHTLWRHGLQFLMPDMLVGSWDEQLYITRPFYFHAGESLSDQIDTIVKYGFGSLVCYDHEVEFLLHVDTNLSNIISTGFDLDFSAEEEAVLERSLWGKIKLYVRRPVIDIDKRLAPLPPEQAPSSIYLIPPYQHIHLAMLHWAEILCLKLQSVFAVGYYSTNSYFAKEEDFLYRFDVAMLSALEQQYLPALQDWLNSIYVLYTPADLKTSPQTEAWLSSLKMWKQQLPDGSTMAYTMPETPDEIRIKDLNAAAQKLLDQRDRSQLPLARIYLQRAQEISAVAHIPQEYFGTTRRLEQIAYMEEHPEIFFE